MHRIRTDPYETMPQAKVRYRESYKARERKRPRLNRNIGFQILQLRKLKFGTQGEMAKRMGGRRFIALISKSERGHIQMLKNLVPICRVLGVPLWEIIRRAEGGEVRDVDEEDRLARWAMGG